MDEQQQNQMQPEAAPEEQMPAGDAPAPQQPPMMDPEMPHEEKKQAGPMVAIVIILALLILGGLYFWGSSLDKGTHIDDLPLIPGDDGNGTAVEEVGSVNELGGNTGTEGLSESTEPVEIEADIDETDLDNLEEELEADLEELDGLL